MDRESYESVYSDLELLAEDACKSSQKGDYYKAICITKFVANILYCFNYTYKMDSLDEVIKNVSQSLVGDIRIKNSKNKRILFYDRFGLSDRGLASIYVKAFLELGYEVVWIIFEGARDEERLKSKFSECRFIVIPRINIMRRLVILKEIITDIVPQHLFLYTEPNDVEGAVIFYSIKGNCKKYLIDLTDHAYWLGKGSVDYYIDFRSLGKNIAVEHRGINAEQIRILPYYPERRDYDYEGMPFEEGCPYFFSGGTSYKIEGSNLFEEIVCHILHTHSELHFVYAHEHGVYSSKLDSIKEKYQGRVHLIEERRDIEEIMKRAKFYLSTYPIAGGLMTQYALKNKCVPISFVDDDIFSNPKTWLLNVKEIDFVFSDLKQLYDKVDRILANDNEEELRKERLPNHVISELAFKNRLGEILNGQDILDDSEIDNIQFNEFQSFYKNRFSYTDYKIMVANSGNPWVKEFYSNPKQ